MKDFYLDNGHFFSIATAGSSIPGFVSEAEPQNEKVASICDEGFADPVARLFPVNTAAETWISGLYAGRFAKEAGDVLSAIRKRASVFGVLEDVERAIQLGSSFTNLDESEPEPSIKTAAFSIELGVVGASKIAGAGGDAVLRAENLLHENLHKVPIHMVKSAAASLVEAGEQNDVKVSLRTRKLAGIGSSSATEIGIEKGARLARIHDPVVQKEAFVRLEKAASAEDLASFDQDYQLDTLYRSGGISHPMEVFHSGMEPKTASLEERIREAIDDEGIGGLTHESCLAAFGAEKTAALIAGGLEIGESEERMLRQFISI